MDDRREGPGHLPHAGKPARLHCELGRDSHPPGYEGRDPTQVPNMFTNPVRLAALLAVGAVQVGTPRGVLSAHFVDEETEGQ